jgi:hypothetical protein
MKKVLLIIIFLVMSCSQGKIENNFKVNNNMSIDEFKKKLEEYSKNNPYPKIDE